jgi:hypothetical protein
VPVGALGDRPAGLLRVLPVPLSRDERESLQRSARTVRAVLDQLGL